jgi:hypothetical protein
MPHKCSKCGKEFLLKSRFRGHLRRKTSCCTQTSMDAFQKLVEVTLAKIHSWQPGQVPLDMKPYFENRMNDLLLFHRNLPESDKERAQELYDDELKEALMGIVGVV